MLNNRWLWSSRSSSDSRFYSQLYSPAPKNWCIAKSKKCYHRNPSVTRISDNKATEQRTPTEIIRSPGIIGGGSNTSAVFSFQGRGFVYRPDEQTRTWVWRPIWTQTWISSLTLDAHVPQTLKSLKMWNLIRFHKTLEIDRWNRLVKKL